jgi:mono/diheme cytochrome c family protein
MTMASRPKTFLFLLVTISVVLLVIAVASAASDGVLAASPLSPPVDPTRAAPMGHDPLARLAEPPLSDPPTQIELGHHAYWFSCMVCHGDRGQGLTDEWREVNPMPDQNCWQARCHGPSHPPWGFEVPRTAPAVIGTEALSTTQTVAALQAYMQATMPWPYPGLFDDETYWQLAAYLADVNHIVLPDEPLGPENGGSVFLGLRYVPGQEPNVWLQRAVTAGVLVLLVGSVVFFRWPRPK